MKLRRIALVFNPKGGSARQNVARELAGSFSGVEVLATPTTAEPGSATVLTRNAVQSGVDAVIAMGGDGTACQVAEGLMGTDVPMSIFPQGTGNLFARAFFAGLAPASFASMILSGVPQPIDMIRLRYKDVSGQEHRRMFMVALGVGKLSDAVSFTSQRMKRTFGRAAYSVRVAAAGLNPKPQRFTLTAGDRLIQQRASTIMVLNVVPGQFSFMSPGCCASDGLMDVGVMTAGNCWQMTKLAVWSLLRMPERSGHYHRFRAPELTIESTEPVNPNIDGDPSHFTSKLHMSVVPSAVRMVLAA